METLNDVRIDTFYISQGSPPYDTIPQFNVLATIGGYGESASRMGKPGVDGMEPATSSNKSSGPLWLVYW